MKFDFDSIKTRLIDSLRAKTSWSEILQDSTSHRILDVVSDGIAELARYDEYLLRESKWNLAQNRSSLVSQASVLGYQPHRKVGAVGNIAVASSEETFSESWRSWKTYNTDDIVSYNDRLYISTIDSNFNMEPGVSGNWTLITRIYPYRVGIPVYTQFSSNSLPYTSVQQATLTPDKNYVNVKVVQGEYRSVTVVAEGRNFEEIEIDDDSVDENYYEVFVNGTKWTEVSDIRKAETSAFRFQLMNQLDFSGVILRFGDDITGKKLESGDVVEFRYIQTSGAAGNVTATGAITNIDDSLVDINGNSANLYCYNFNAVAGGKDYEEIESIRTNGRDTFLSGSQLISARDYEAFFRTFDYIGNVIVWGAFEQNIDEGNDLWTYVAAQENLVYVSAYTPGSDPLDVTLNTDGTPNPAYKIDMLERITEKKPVTDIIQFMPVDFVYMAFHSALKVSDRNYLLPEVVQSVEDAIWAAYNIEKLDFKQNIYETNYKRLIDEVPGVDYHNSYIELYWEGNFLAGDDGSGTAYSTSGNLQIFDIEPGTLEVWVYRDDESSPLTIKAAVDNEAGVIVDANLSVQSGSVNYSTGAFSIAIDDVSITGAYQDYYVRVYYRPVDLDIKPKKRNQVLFLKDVTDVTAEYV